MQKIMMIFGNARNLFEGDVVNVVDFAAFAYPTDPTKELMIKIGDWLQTTDTQEFIKGINEEIKTKNFLTTHEVKFDPCKIHMINVTGVDDDLLETFIGLSARCPVRAADKLIKKMIRDEVIKFPKTYVMTFTTFDTEERLYVKINSFFDEDQLSHIRSEMNFPVYSYMNSKICIGKFLGIYEVKPSVDHAFIHMLETEYLNIKALNDYAQEFVDAKERKLLN